MALPKLVGLTARRKSEMLRTALLSSELFDGSIVPYTAVMSAGFSASLVNQAIGQPDRADKIWNQFSEEVIDASSVAPVELSEEHLNRWLGRLTGGPEQFFWEKSAADFHLNDLCCATTIAGAAAAHARWNQARIDAIYEEIRDIVEHKYRIVVRGV